MGLLILGSLIVNACAVGVVALQSRKIKKLERRVDRQDALLVDAPVNMDGRLLGRYSGS